MLKGKTADGGENNRSQLGSCKAMDTTRLRPSVTASDQTPQKEFIFLFHCESKVSDVKPFLPIHHPLSVT